MFDSRNPLSRRSLLGRLAVAGAFACVALPASGKPVAAPAPGPRDVCPVCGMFVAPYPYWTATILYKDGQAVHFDGAKDFFKYLFDMGKYATGRTRDDIRAMGVTDYYETRRIDAAEALFVIGSDVLGPMGHELVPLDTEADASEFIADHKGVRSLRFSEVTKSLVEGLDSGRFT